MWSLRDIESKIEILEVDGEAQLEAENALRNLLRACFLLIVEILHDEGKISDEKKALLEGAVDEIVDEIGWTPSNE
jgi:DNA-nicking Smr family endonuclease